MFLLYLTLSVLNNFQPFSLSPTSYESNEGREWWVLRLLLWVLLFVFLVKWVVRWCVTKL